jgi:hypothetical protein
VALEQETKGLIMLGFIITLAIVAVSIILLWNKTKNQGLLWFLPQLVMLSLCLHLFIKLINNEKTVSPVMLSEENSLIVGFMGISWALSMIFMMIGITMSIKNKSKMN